MWEPVRRCVHVGTAQPWYAFPVHRSASCWLFCLLAACSESSGPSDTDGALLDALSDAPAVTDAADAAALPRFIAGPTIAQNPQQAVPLAAIVTFKTDVAVAARLEVSDGTNSREVAFTETATDFALPVLGLAPQGTYAIKVTISDQQGNEVTAPDALSFTAGPLPADFPPLTVTVNEPGKVEPGILVFTPFHETPAGEKHYLMAANGAGQVVWYYMPEDGYSGGFARPLSGGNLIILGKGRVREIDMLGNVVQEWHAAALKPVGPPGSVPVMTDAIHHDILELPSGNLLAIGRELRTYNDYPTSDTDPAAPKATGAVVGDVVIEFKRDGTTVNTWALLDVLDPYRIGYGSIGGNVVYPNVALAHDWSHANGLVYSAADDAIIVSLRHQDVIVKLSRKTGKVMWLLGTHANWKPPWNENLLAPQGTLAWPYHTHCPELSPTGKLLVYDNGNYRASPFDTPLTLAQSYSRAVEFSIDEANMTVTQEWSYGGPGGELFYSQALSGVSVQAKTGNVLITDGARNTDAAGNPTLGPAGQRWARIYEVTHTQPSKKVFELLVKEDKQANPVGWKLYRAYKLPSLYPSTLARER